ncbi:hypothetical protein [Micromonospora sp. RL09-050-HVF-A]|uniref:hypothetical protein n=1 Tax=Micromonospora sp. RL09-050-HVF-A TaxID=1703433 RepID=UPI002104F178|nr:hypothetical protein [Micromonospora sp. RL09-050-HVF-A]
MGWLPVEHRAAHLVDAARGYLLTGDPVGAARALIRADRVAPAEVRHRPAVRKVVDQLARDPRAPTTITPLAVSLGLL